MIREYSGCVFLSTHSYIVFKCIQVQTLFASPSFSIPPPETLVLTVSPGCHACAIRKWIASPWSSMVIKYKHDRVSQRKRSFWVQLDPLQDFEGFQSMGSLKIIQIRPSMTSLVKPWWLGVPPMLGNLQCILSIHCKDSPKIGVQTAETVTIDAVNVCGSGSHKPPGCGVWTKHDKAMFW